MGTGRYPLGGLSARAYDAPHEPAKIVRNVKHGAEFTSSALPARSAMSMGGRVWLWPAGTPGTVTRVLQSGDDVVIVPITVQGVFP